MKNATLVDAYQNEMISSDQLDRIASFYPSKAMDVYSYSDGFCVAFEYEDRYKQNLAESESQNVNYRELCHHQNESGETDWVLACDLYRLHGIYNNNVRE